MKMKYVVFAVLLSLVLCAPAMAEMKTFGNIKVDVPKGWTTMEQSGAVVLVAPDKSASVTAVKAPSGGMTVESMATQTAQALNGKASQVDDDAYKVEANVNGVSSTTYMMDIGNGQICIIAVSGNSAHPDVEGIVSSIE